MVIELHEIENIKLLAEMMAEKGISHLNLDGRMSISVAPGAFKPTTLPDELLKEPLAVDDDDLRYHSS